jgi:hypothetical protein
MDVFCGGTNWTPTDTIPWQGRLVTPPREAYR